MKKVNALVLGLAVLLAVGCGGDEPEPDNDNSQENIKSCRLKTIDYGTTQYNFVYNSHGKIDQALNNRGDIEKHEYNSLGKVSRHLVLQSGTDTIRITTYEYNADSLVSSYISKARNDSSRPFTTLFIQSFQYDSQKRVFGKSHHNIYQPSVIWSKESYTHLSNNNVVIKTYNLDQVTNSWEFKSETAYTFDNHKLPRGESEIFSSVFPHNILTTTYTPFTNGVPGATTLETTTYTYNTAGYPTESVSTGSGGSSQITKYTYDCQ